MGTMLRNEIGAIGDEVRVHAEDGLQRAFSLRGGVVIGLEAADGSVDENAQDREVGKNSGTNAEVWQHDERRQIVAAKSVFWYFLRRLGGMMRGRCGGRRAGKNSDLRSYGAVTVG